MTRSNPLLRRTERGPAIEDHRAQWATWLAERFSGFTVRRDDEPVDVARIHREVADDIVDRLDADHRGAVDALREYADHRAGCPARDAGVKPATCTCGVNAVLAAFGAR